MMRCALVGNPNAGKTTLFNALTGAYQRVGNWSGVTVAEKKATLQLGEQCIELVDLPGMYALDTTPNARMDEQLAADAVLSENIDCLINVLDASQLERHLYLTSQLIALGRPMILVLTMMDKAKKQGIHVDADALASKLGCPVLVMSRGEGRDALIAALQQAVPVPDVLGEVEGEDDELVMMDARYTAVHALVQCVETRDSTTREQFTAKLDRVLLHRFFALPLFFMVMYALFFVVIRVGGYFQDAFTTFADGVLLEGGAHALYHVGVPVGFAHWLTDGIGRGFSTTLSFIPVMGLMFFLLACLEESGYMARVAFVMDRAMRFIGLPGKAFVPLMMGFGCNVPAVMAARTLDSERDRKLLILMSPFMSCSARLTIYTVFVAAFFPKGGYNVVFSLYIVGLMMAVLTGLLLRKTLFSGPLSPLLLELPTYHMPAWRVLLRGTTRKLRAFLWRAGKVIVPVCALLGVLNAVQLGAHHSLLVWCGQSLQPLFAPMGISPNNWPAVVGLITGVLAKEVVVGSLNSMYGGLGNLAQAFDGAVGAYAYLLFVLLYVPCASTVAVVRQEAGKRLMWFSVVWSTLLAYSSAVLFYQLGTAYLHVEQSMLWSLSLIGLFVCCAFLIKSGVFIGGPRVARTS